MGKKCKKKTQWRRFSLNEVTSASAQEAFSDCDAENLPSCRSPSLPPSSEHEHDSNRGTWNKTVRSGSSPGTPPDERHAPHCDTPSERRGLNDSPSSCCGGSPHKGPSYPRFLGRSYTMGRFAKGDAAPHFDAHRKPFRFCGNRFYFQGHGTNALPPHGRWSEDDPLTGSHETSRSSDCEKTSQPVHTVYINNEEYTKIQTPRQEVIFKKGSLDRKRDSVDLASNSGGSVNGDPSIATTDQGSVAEGEDAAELDNTSTVESQLPYEEPNPLFRSEPGKPPLAGVVMQQAYPGGPLFTIPVHWTPFIDPGLIPGDTALTPLDPAFTHVIDSKDLQVDPAHVLPLQHDENGCPVTVQVKVDENGVPIEINPSALTIPLSTLQEQQLQANPNIYYVVTPHAEQPPQHVVNGSVQAMYPVPVNDANGMEVLSSEPLNCNKDVAASDRPAEAHPAVEESYTYPDSSDVVTTESKNMCCKESEHEGIENEDSSSDSQYASMSETSTAPTTPGELSDNADTSQVVNLKDGAHRSSTCTQNEQSNCASLPHRETMLSICNTDLMASELVANSCSQTKDNEVSLSETLPQMSPVIEGGELCCDSGISISESASCLSTLVDNNSASALCNSNARNVLSCDDLAFSNAHPAVLSDASSALDYNSPLPSQPDSSGTAESPNNNTQVTVTSGLHKSTKKQTSGLGKTTCTASKDLCPSKYVIVTEETQVDKVEYNSLPLSTDLGKEAFQRSRKKMRKDRRRLVKDPKNPKDEYCAQNLQNGATETIIGKYTVNCSMEDQSTRDDTCATEESGCSTCLTCSGEHKTADSSEADASSGNISVSGSKDHCSGDGSDVQNAAEDGKSCTVEESVVSGVVASSGDLPEEAVVKDVESSLSGTETKAGVSVLEEADMKVIMKKGYILVPILTPYYDPAVMYGCPVIIPQQPLQSETNYVRKKKKKFQKRHTEHNIVSSNEVLLDTELYTGEPFIATPEGYMVAADPLYHMCHFHSFPYMAVPCVPPTPDRMVPLDGTYYPTVMVVNPMGPHATIPPQEVLIRDAFFAPLEAGEKREIQEILDRPEKKLKEKTDSCDSGVSDPEEVNALPSELKESYASESNTESSESQNQQTASDEGKVSIACGVKKADEPKGKKAKHGKCVKEKAVHIREKVNKVKAIDTGIATELVKGEHSESTIVESKLHSQGKQCTMTRERSSQRTKKKKGKKRTNGTLNRQPECFEIVEEIQRCGSSTQIVSCAPVVGEADEPLQSECSQHNLVSVRDKKRSSNTTDTESVKTEREATPDVLSPPHNSDAHSGGSCEVYNTLEESSHETLSNTKDFQDDGVTSLCLQSTESSPADDDCSEQSDSDIDYETNKSGAEEKPHEQDDGSLQTILEKENAEVMKLAPQETSDMSFAKEDDLLGIKPGSLKDLGVTEAVKRWIREVTPTQAFCLSEEAQNLIMTQHYSENDHSDNEDSYIDDEVPRSNINDDSDSKNVNRNPFTASSSEAMDDFSKRVATKLQAHLDLGDLEEYDTASTISCLSKRRLYSECSCSLVTSFSKSFDADSSESGLKDSIVKMFDPASYAKYYQFGVRVDSDSSVSPDSSHNSTTSHTLNPSTSVSRCESELDLRSHQPVVCSKEDSVAVERFMVENLSHEATECIQHREHFMDPVCGQPPAGVTLSMHQPLPESTDAFVHSPLSSALTSGIGSSCVSSPSMSPQHRPKDTLVMPSKLISHPIKSLGEESLPCKTVCCSLM